MRLTDTRSSNDHPAIRIRGARQNNLRNLDLDFVPGTLTVITGPSGSGKSSLAFDTLYAEGQRRYVETFSPYARQFLDRCDRPKVDKIEGVPPAIAINQSAGIRTSRSTVGTMTELNDHLKLLFERLGKLYCPSCGRHVHEMSASDIWQDIQAKTARLDNPKIVITFNVLVPNTLDRALVEQSLSAQGFTRIHMETQRPDASVLAVTVDRFRLKRADDSRAVEAIEKALELGKDAYRHRMQAHVEVAPDHYETIHYAKGFVCPDCERSFTPASGSLFSFNSAVGACPTCRGFGRTIELDLDLVIPDKTLSLAQGCVKPWQGSGASAECQTEMMRYAKRDNIRTDVPFDELTEEERRWVVEGEPKWSGKWSRQWYGIRHYFDYLESKAYKMHVRVMLSRYRTYCTCKTCQGARLKPEGLWWRVGSSECARIGLGVDRMQTPYRRFVPRSVTCTPERLETLPGLTIHDLMLLPVAQLDLFFEALQNETTDEAGLLVIREIRRRINYLKHVGLGYLTLDRQSRTLSGGEVQRVNLTTALGSNLVNTLFVLDEPSIGLHPRDIDRINAIMLNLRNAGNTLVVVEHDPQMMTCADRIIDMGPAAGSNGGAVMFDGTPEQIRSDSHLTGSYLSGKCSVIDPVSCPKTPLPDDLSGHPCITIKGAAQHNLQHVTARFPLGALTCVTGVSGSGKSSLISDILFPAVERHFGRPSPQGRYTDIEGLDRISDVCFIDQSAIGKTSRSNPVIYVDAFTPIRQLFSETASAQARGYTAGDFGFNSGNGRCPTCQGAGFERVEMQFLSDVYLRCPDCNGSRYRSELLEVTINLDGRGPKNIADVLDMTVDEAMAYFVGQKKVTNKLQALADVGLGYVKLGQPVPTLSGGEAQRLKLAGQLAESAKSSSHRRLYILDEPTTGLHFSDIALLLKTLRRLVRLGHTVIVVEHNLDVMAASDWLIDLGPEGGDEGGRIVGVGTPDAFVQRADTYTARALSAYVRGEPIQGLFARADAIPSPGRSLQSVWRHAKNGDLGVFGAKEHNLRSINAIVPKNTLTTVTGVSGSGKSSLAFGVIFSEGQRRYLESLNAYARSIIQPGVKADVESVVGIAPTVAIEQRTSRGGRKSTVATLTEIQHFLRLLYVKLGVQHCPKCRVEVHVQSTDVIVADIMKRWMNQTVTLAAPVVVARKGIYTELAKTSHERGITHLRVDGHWVPTHPFPALARYKEHTIESPVHTLTITPESEPFVRRYVNEALFHGHGLLTLLWGTQSLNACDDTSDGGQETYSTKRACPHCLTSFPEPDPRLFSYNSKLGWCPTCFGTGRLLKGFDEQQTGEEAEWNDELVEDAVCPDCGGLRLNEIARSVLFHDRSICDTTQLSVDDCLTAMQRIELEGREKAIGEDALKEIVSRLQFLKEVGLGYLALDRDAPSLSGGEAQRIRLAAQLGSNLQGVCYVLDEPTIGLHPRDNQRLVSTLINLKNKGNTVLVVEHDEDTIRRSDHIIDIGPGAGVRGGTLVAQGALSDIMNTPESVTGRLLAHPLRHTGKARRPVTDETESLFIKGARLHNLKGIDVRFPLGRLIVLTGISGSGKSTLARNILLRSLNARLNDSKNDLSVYGCDALDGAHLVTRVLEVDQTPIGKTPRSCPATYVGFFNQIRTLFAASPQALERGYEATRFSFNTAQGRCPMCQGQGQITVSMNFLPDVKVPCEACHGMRFDNETLSVKWRDQSIGDVLNLPVDTALEHFASSPRIAHPLQLLQDVGLGYLTLGQPSNTLSGGEAQRIKLVTELAKAYTPAMRLNARNPKTFYILDEPTVGLHMADVEKLIHVLHRLVDAGNTVLVVEHNLDVIAEADYIIDLGPEGGPDGGRLVGTGSPADIAVLDTPTGKALHDFLREHQA